MNPPHKPHSYCADSPVLALPIPLDQRIRLALKAAHELQAAARKSDDTLRATILRAQLMTDAYSDDLS